MDINAIFTFKKSGEKLALQINFQNLNFINYQKYMYQKKFLNWYSISELLNIFVVQHQKSNPWSESYAGTGACNILKLAVMVTCKHCNAGGNNTS